MGWIMRVHKPDGRVKETRHGITTFPGRRGKTDTAMTAMSCSCTPREVRKFQRVHDDAGIGCTFKPDGKCYCPSREVRNRLYRFRGFHDKDAGYSDPTPA